MPLAAERIIQCIASVAEAVGEQAGVGGLEMAGMIISVLAADPTLTATFLDDPLEFMLSDHMRAERGCLTFHRKGDGKVVRPEQLRTDRAALYRSRIKPVEKQRGDESH